MKYFLSVATEIAEKIYTRNVHRAIKNDTLKLFVIAKFFLLSLLLKN